MLTQRKPFADVLGEASLGDLYAMRRDAGGLAPERLRRVETEIARREAGFAGNRLDRDAVQAIAADEARAAVRSAIRPVTGLILLVGFLAGACAAILVLAVFRLI